MMRQNVMTSEVLHNHLEATYITVDSVRVFGVKQKPSLVLVNSQGAPFTYRENQVSGEMDKNWLVVASDITSIFIKLWYYAVVFKL